MKNSSPKLPLTQEERLYLRRSSVKLSDIARMNPTNLSSVLGSNLDRARFLCALASFQTIPSIGPKAAQWVLDLGFYSLEEIRNENGADLVERLEERYGYWMDPCVEDTLRCIVHHAKNPQSEKCWFDFSEERKRHRATYGYTAGRPSRPWYEAKG